MRHSSFVRFSSLFYFLLPLASLLLLDSCEKDMKTTAAVQTESSDRLSLSTDNLATAGFDTSGLVAWFDFNNGSLQDKSQYHNKIIFNNATPAADRNGIANNAFYFNGNGDYMRVKNSASLNPTNGITLFAIVNISDFYAGKCHDNRIINKTLDGNPGYYDLDFSDALYTNHANCTQDVDKAHESFDGNWDGTGATDSTEYVQTNHWYHIVYTYGAGKGKLYIDGKLVSLFTGQPHVLSSDDDVFFGTLNTAVTEYPYWLNGTIDQIGIFNTALNAAQVAKLSNL